MFIIIIVVLLIVPPMFGFAHEDSPMYYIRRISALVIMLFCAVILFGHIEELSIVQSYKDMKYVLEVSCSEKLSAQQKTDIIDKCRQINYHLYSAQTQDNLLISFYPTSAKNLNLLDYSELL